MNRGQFAMWTLLLGSVMGVLGAVFFFDTPPGISVLIFTAMMIASVVTSAIQADTPVNWRNVWLAAPMLFFSGMVSVFASEYLAGLNIIFAGIFALLFIHFIAHPRMVHLSSGMTYISGMLEAFTGTVLIDPIVNGREVAGWVRRQKHDTFFAVMRGLAIALPIFILFAIFLSRSDLLFAERLGRVWTVFRAPVETLLPWLLIAITITWMVTGAISYAIARNWLTESDGDEKPTGGCMMILQKIIIPLAVAMVTGGVLTYLGSPFAKRFGDWVYLWAWVAALAVAYGTFSTLEARYQRGVTEDADAGKNKNFGGLQLGIVESSIVLGAVNLLFAGYVFTQFSPRDGMTYAEVARRGFFELVLVSVMAIALLLIMNVLTTRANNKQETIVRGLSMVTILLSIALLAFAWLRINNYIDVYGYTHRRLWVQVFMPWMVVLFVVLILHLLNVRRNAFSLGVLVVIIGYLVTMNVININGFVAKHNIDRYLSGDHELDLCYLLDLSADATPELIRLAERKEDDMIRRAVGRKLRNTQQRLSATRYENVFAYNLSNSNVRSLLNQHEPQIETYLASDGGTITCVVEPTGANLASVK